MVAQSTWLVPRGAWRSLLALLAALLLWCAGAGSARAGAVITNVTFNGQGNVTVVPGATISVTLYVTLSNARWRKTQIDTSPVTSMTCIDNTDVSADGNYSFTFNYVAPASNGLYDISFYIQPNANCTSGATATRILTGAVKVDNTFPVVLSITRDLPDPTNASPVTWTVTFDRPVSGVTLSDFTLPANGVGGTTLSGTITSSSVYVLRTPNTGSGTLGLNVIDNDSIIGPNGLALGGAGINNGNFTGQVYTIDRVPPTFTVVGISSNNAVSALFARVGERISVTFTTADANGVQTPTATINGAGATVTGAGNSWVASRLVVASDVEGLVAFKLDVNDVAGNAATSRTSVTNGSSVTIDNTAPVASIACANPALCGAANPVSAGQVSWSVTFSEAVTGVSAANFTLSGSGATIASVSGSGTTYTVVANVSTAGVVGLNLSANLANVRDRAGNNPGANTAVASNSYTVGGCSVAAGGGCTFDAVETGAGAGTPIFTKRVGATVTLDILARNGAALNTGSSDTVVATLVVADKTATCGTVAVAPPVTLTFAPANGGRRSIPFTPSRAAREVRVKLESSGVTACSSDNFALRPDAFSLASADANADAAGVSFIATPVIKAGTQFGIQASSAAGYDGTPSFDQNMVKVLTGNTKGVLSGSFGVANASGVASGNAFTYSEVGYVGLNSWGVYDDGSFAAVDSAKGECVTATLGGGTAPTDPNTANAAGKLGCYFGSAASPYFGRFIPDHFALSAGTIVNRSGYPLCTSAAFTYMGEALKPSFVLTAQNAANATTVNYTDTLARLNIPTQLGLGAIDDPAGGTRRPLAVCAATPVGPCLNPSSPTGSFSNGVSTAIVVPFIVERATTVVAPYTALKVGVAPIDPDGVRIATYNLDTVNVPVGANQHALVGSTQVRYGRLQVDNAYGSELLNLGVKIAAQYWNGSSYSTNTLDSCTPLGTAEFTLTLHKDPLSTVNMGDTHILPGTPMAGGAGRVLLTKPSPVPTGKGSAVLKSKSLILPGSGRVTFGVYKSGPVIYVRETY